jgi:hypothetical protein
VNAPALRSTDAREHALEEWEQLVVNVKELREALHEGGLRLIDKTKTYGRSDSMHPG